MANILQVLSDKAKETRDQLTRSAQASLQGSSHATSTSSRAELHTNREPAALTEPVRVTARDPITSPSTEEPLWSIGDASASTDYTNLAKPDIGVPRQPLSDAIRMYLLAFAAACLIYNHAEGVLHFLNSTGIGLLDIVAVMCLVAAAPALPRTQMNQTLQALRLQATSAGVAMKALPQMSVEMSAMLDEIRAMRHDLRGMAKKTAWLPGS